MASQHPNQQTQGRRTRETDHNGEAEARGSDILRSTLEEFKERSDDLKTLAKEYVNEKPYKALGIVLGVGVVIGLLMKR